MYDNPETENLGRDSGTSGDRYYLQPPIKPWKRVLIGAYLMIGSVILAGFVVVLWPLTGQDEADREVGLILIVLLTGALGASVHATTSFATFVGNRTLKGSWMWWYTLRPVIGAALAVIFYFVIQGGLLSLVGDTEKVNAYALAAIAGLVGMFSKQATDKLRDLFDNLFKTDKGDEHRGDKLTEKLARPVAEIMLKIQEITTYTIPEGKAESQIKLHELLDLLVKPVTRIPILGHDGVAKYIIHQSMLYRFIAEKGVRASKESTPFDAQTLTLAQLLAAPGMRSILAESFVFVAPDATVGEAKLKMERKSGCQDVLVTATGSKDEPVLGWLTNTDILRHSES